MKRYVSETWRAVPRSGLNGAAPIVFVTTGITWGAQGFGTAVGVFVAGVAGAAVVLLPAARASVNSAARGS
ncbi:hypothetical protein [Rhodococcus xishaensis]|uniref:Uncharacterized protein n=1 Tax=Rhodococcus xishaensis TaxID=2487364 RepID=A0A3S3A804_9NOCA|nr:hypothetical protein [Rhodococcus xishaensis]RVW04135.1 hypothetical protein EGT50_06560 [Rhodococcus xishaensis]